MSEQSGTAEPSGAQMPPDDEQMLALAGRLFDAARGGHASILVPYLDAGVPVDLTNSTGDTLLMLAAYHGHAPLVELLLRRGAKADTLNDRGQSPLAGAVFKGYADVVEVLAAAGADPDAGTPSAREAAAFFQRPDLARLLDRHAGADPAE